MANILLMVLTFVVFISYIFIYKFRILSLEKDYFLLLFLMQVIIYVHIVPNVYLLTINFKDGIIYFLLELIVFIFFEVPIIILYYNKSKLHKQSKNLELVVTKSKTRLILFVIGIIFLAFLFLQFSIQYNVLFRRIGHQQLYEASISMPTYKWAIYRTFIETGVFISSLLLIGYYKSKNKNKKLFLICFIIYVVLYGGYTLINNRLQTVIFLVVLFGINIFFKNNNFKKINFRKIIVLVFFVLYLIKIVVNIRDTIVVALINKQTSISLSILNPFYDTGLIHDDPISNRLNGLQFIAQFTPKIPSNGFVLLGPWIHSVKIVYGTIFNTEYANESKKKLETNTRAIISRYYFNKAPIDRPQSMLTDAFASFGPLGLLFLAYIIALYFSAIKKNFIEKKSLFYMMLSIMILPFLLEFEKDSMNFIIGWLRVIPFFIVIYNLKIFNIRENIETTNTKLKIR